MQYFQVIKGKHSITEALKANANIDRILIDYKNRFDADIISIKKQAEKQKIKVQILPSDSFEKLKENNSQNILAYLHSQKTKDLDWIIENIEINQQIIALDHLQDPYNFGAIIRTCEAFGIKTIIYPKDRNCQITPGVVKASSGAINHINLIKVTNLNQSIIKLKKAGYWIYATDVHNGSPLSIIQPNTPSLLIVGNEEKGVSPLLKAQSDHNIHIPMIGKIESLNVSVATGIIIYTFFNNSQK